VYNNLLLIFSFLVLLLCTRISLLLVLVFILLRLVFIIILLPSGGSIGLLLPTAGAGATTAVESARWWGEG
jgi:hypothetical protein